MDEEGKLFDRFVEDYIPYNVILDKEGTVRYAAVGYKAGEIAKVIDELTAK